MEKNTKKIILIIVAIIIIVIGFSCAILTYKLSNPSIEKILKKDAYSYLPVEAKNFIEEYYENTGVILLTEKNKKEGEIYLNPNYVDYLTLSDKEKEEISSEDIPRATLSVFSSKSSQVYGASDLPTSYDLRDVDGNSYVTPVRNQGSLNLSFAFSIAESLETHIMLKNNTPYSGVSDLISERQIDYGLSNNGLIDYNSPYKNLIVRGVGERGKFESSTPLLASGASVRAYNDFKEYDEFDKNAMELSDVLRNDKSQYEVMSTDQISLNSLRESDGKLSDEQLETRQSYIDYVKNDIMNYGSAYVELHYSDRCMHTDPTTGLTVLDVPSTSNSNKSCTTSNNDIHSLNIIGWDDEKEYSYCIHIMGSTYYHNATGCSIPVKGKGVWIAKNSKGDSNKPYLYIAYDSILSGLDVITEVKSSSERDWDNSYYIGSESMSFIEQRRTYNASNTNIIGEEKVVRIKSYTEYPGLNVTLKVVDKNGTSHSYSKRVSTAGLFYFDITDNLIVNSSSTFTLSAPKATLYDSLSIFTENISPDPKVDMSSLNEKKVENYLGTGSVSRYYFTTKNIEDGSLITFKLYDSDGNDISTKLSVADKTNIVSQNGVNALMTFSNGDKKGIYIVKAYYEDTLVGECNVFVNSMEGSGTSTNPFVVTNAVQFDEIRYGLHSNYILNNDIDFLEDTSGDGELNKESLICNDGYGFQAIDGFSGSINGNDKTLLNLRQNNYLTCTVNHELKKDINYSGNGLFSNAYGNVTITNLHIKDFNINCSGGSCGVLISNYKDYKDIGVDSKYLTVNNVSASNIVINGNADSTNTNEELRKVVGGGLLGNISSNNGYVNLGLLYIGYDLTNSNIYNKGLLASSINGKYTSLYDIQLAGTLKGNSYGTLKDAILFNSLTSNTLNINRILSTVKASNVKSSLLGEFNSSTSTTISDIKTIAIEGKSICDTSNDCSSATGVNEYNINSQFNEFITDSNYSSWLNFSSNWSKEVVNEMNRFPFINSYSPQYSNIENINIVQSLNVDYNIKNYISPNNMLTRNIITSVDDESILKIDDDGRIDILSTGSTNVSIKSLYDGFVKDISINVTYTPHYTIILDSNGGVGDTIYHLGSIGSSYTVPDSSFTRNDYMFIGWNTERDGTGMYYKPGDKINNLSNKDISTLFAQWRSLDDPADIYSGLYDIDLDTKIIDFIQHDTSIDTFFDKIYYNGYRVEVDTKNINGVDKLYTGGKTRVYLNNVLKNEYTNIVRGDVNGNGKTDIIDYIKIRKDIMDMEKLSGIYLKAADVNQNNTIDIIDYIRIRKIIMEEE